MPLIKSNSPKAFTSNLKAELSAGKPKKQALAIAYSEAGEKKANGGLMEHEDMHEMMMEVAKELCEGVKTDNHEMVMQALEALVLHIQDKDEEQDSQMEPMS